MHGKCFTCLGMLIPPFLFCNNYGYYLQRLGDPVLRPFLQVIHSSSIYC